MLSHFSLTSAALVLTTLLGEAAGVAKNNPTRTTSTASSTASSCQYPPAPAKSGLCPSPSISPYGVPTGNFYLRVYGCNNPYNGRYITVTETKPYYLTIADTPYGPTEFFYTPPVGYSNAAYFNATGKGTPDPAKFVNVSVTNEYTNTQNPTSGFRYLTPPGTTLPNGYGFTAALVDLNYQLDDPAPVSSDVPSTDAFFYWYGSGLCPGQPYYFMGYTYTYTVGDLVKIGTGCSNSSSRISTFVLGLEFECS